MVKRKGCPDTRVFYVQCLENGLEWNRKRSSRYSLNMADSEQKCRKLAEFIIELTVEV